MTKPACADTSSCASTVRWSGKVSNQSTHEAASANCKPA
jgi:hypothetical protein